MPEPCFLTADPGQTNVDALRVVAEGIGWIVMLAAAIGLVAATSDLSTGPLPMKITLFGFGLAWFDGDRYPELEARMTRAGFTVRHLGRYRWDWQRPAWVARHIRSRPQRD